MSQFIAVVDRFEGEFAVLKHKDHEILLPKEDLPTDISEGGFVTIIALSEGKEKIEQKNKEKEVKGKINQLLEEQENPTEPPKSTQEKIEESFNEESRGNKIQHVINDVISTSLGQEPVYESPEKKEIRELKQISGKMDKVSQNIQEEIEDHKEHEEG